MFWADLLHVHGECAGSSLGAPLFRARCLLCGLSLQCPFRSVAAGIPVLADEPKTGTAGWASPLRGWLLYRLRLQPSHVRL